MTTNRQVGASPVEDRLIIHVTTVHPWWDNRIYEKMVLGLRQRGWNILYIHPSPSGQTTNQPAVPNIALPAGGGMMRRVHRNIRAFLECRKNPGAIIHFHDPEFLPFALLLRLAGHPVIYDIHEDNLLSIPQKGGLPLWARHLVARFIAGIEWLGARILVPVIAERAYAKRFPAGVPVLNYPEKNAAVIRPGHRSTPGTRRLLYTGCLSEDRGALHHVDLLLRLPKHELYMIGRCDDALRRMIEDRAGTARDRLHLIVREEGLPFGEIRKLYIEGEWEWGLAVFPDTPHYREKELTKFFEYMFYRIPIVYSNFPTWRRLISNEYGIAVNPNDLDSAAEALVSTSVNFSSYRTLDYGIAHQYTWTSQLDQLNELYIRLGAK